MIEKIVKDYLNKKGYVAVKKCDLFYAEHIFGLTAEEIQGKKYNPSNPEVKEILIGFINNAKDRLINNRLK